ncbi:MAG: hypothetical protein QXT68_09765 [Halobacteria archaeon]
MIAPGIALAAAFDTAFTWARWQKWLRPVAALRAFLRVRAARAPIGATGDPAGGQEFCHPCRLHSRSYRAGGCRRRMEGAPSQDAADGLLVVLGLALAGLAASALAKGLQAPVESGAPFLLFQVAGLGAGLALLGTGLRSLARNAFPEGRARRTPGRPHG